MQVVSDLLNFSHEQFASLDGFNANSLNANTLNTDSLNTLKTLSDQQLHQKMLKTSQTERELTAQMIALIQEASRRKFYLDLGYGTLFAYLTEGLKYSASSAMRRIDSAKIANDIPEVKEKVLDGSLNLSNLARAQQFFKNEAKGNHKFNIEEKKEVLKMLEGQSTREAERTLASLSTQPVQTAQVEQVKPLTKELSKISFLADQEFMDQLEEVKGLLASKMPGASVSEILSEVMKLGLLSLRKKRFKLKDDLIETNSKVETPVEKKPALQSESVSGAGSRESGKDSVWVSKTKVETQTQIQTQSPDSRYIPAAVQREVWLRDEGKCRSIHPKTGKRCASGYDLEFDHYPIPKAAGGDNSVGNLRLLCRSCNVLHGVRNFGRKKMTTYSKQRF